jgi:hypothetical protein
MSGEGVKGGDWEPLEMIYDMQEKELQRYVCIYTYTCMYMYE